MTYTILLCSFVSSIFVSLFTAPVKDKEIDEFYSRVRPFGVWGKIEKRVMASGKPMATKLSFGRVLLNSLIGCTGMLAMYMLPTYVMGHWLFNAAVCIGIIMICLVILYFTWFKRLPND